MDQKAGDVASYLIRPEEMLPRRTLQDLTQTHIRRRIADRRKLSPIRTAEFLHGEFLERNVLKLRWPIRESDAHQIILEDREVNPILIPHHERFIACEYIGQCSYSEKDENNDQAGNGNAILPELP